ncbi:hypothetical protein [Streptomyces sp. NPDC102264]|uniref:hypothetical protein n=1 Tax=Streptomyces sp. NPDC102264 TaxID=3366149 RepID=UPI003824ABE1
MTEYISYAPWRREEWKGHRTKKAVRQAIAYDRGRGRLTIFARGVNGTGEAFLLEVPQARWAEQFEEAE